MKKIYIFLAAGLALAASRQVQAGFSVKNTQTCLITGANFADLQEAVKQYNKSSNRLCTWLISFTESGEMEMTSAIEIKGNPVHDGEGTLISRTSAANFVLDATGRGDCPIKAKVGAKIAIKRITIKVDNVDKAICDTAGNPVYDDLTSDGHVTSQTDAQEEVAYIHPDVTILPAGSDCAANDQDCDGIIDVGDNCPSVRNPLQEDTDGDGIGDACDIICVSPIGTPDTDGDGIADNCDDDDDGDGVLDINDECSGTPLGTPVLSNGCPLPPEGCDTSDPTQDSDGDGLANGVDPKPCDADADGDGTCDGPLAVAGYCAAGPDQCPLDSSRIVKNSLGQCAPEPGSGDSDPDGDGLTNTLEADLGTDPNDADTDNDSYGDGIDCFPLDGAKHGCGEGVIVVDPDFDNDGICDLAQTATDPVTGNPCTPNPSGRGDNCIAIANPDQKDNDADGIGDVCDPSPSGSTGEDADVDGVPDALENGVQFCTDSSVTDTDRDGLKDGDEVNGKTNQGGFGPCDPDVDSDGICDGPATLKDEEDNEICNAGPNGTGDNCPIVDNSDQKDSDGNGIGDACEGDTDGDGIPDNGEDRDDNCPFISNGDQRDEDGDGIGDLCDTDFDLVNALRASGGCGCRIDGPGGKADMLPFLAMMIPLVLLRMLRKRSKNS